MQPFRALGLTLVLGWHAIAGGVGSLLHTCTMEVAEPSRCKCPHGKKADAAQDQLRRADCCSTDFVRADVKPALKESARAADSFAPALVALPAISAVDVAPFSAQVHAWRISAPSQGPPVYLKVRSLLI